MGAGVKILLERVPDQGMDVNLSLDQAWVREAARLGLEVEAEELDGELHIEKVASSLRVTGELRARARSSCDRCNAPIQLSLEGEVELLYSPLSGAPEADEVDLEEDDLDVGWFDGVALEMEQVVSEQLALWLPERKACEEEGVERLVPGPCALPFPTEAVQSGRQRPFAGLKLPE
jgi:uncharacterized metal-binding protein YceD (DUF177 family)